MDIESLEEGLDHALRRGLVTLGRLRRRLEQVGRRRGSGALPRLIAERDGTSGIPQSVFETRFLHLARRGGLPTPTLQYPITTALGTAFIDLAYIEEKIAIEADGFRWHSSRRRWEYD